jgi:hypothetical protein
LLTSILPALITSFYKGIKVIVQSGAQVDITLKALSSSGRKSKVRTQENLRI